MQADATFAMQRDESSANLPPSLNGNGHATRPPAVLTDIAGLAAMLCRSKASLARDDAAGRIPAAVRIGSSKRWRVSEITAWTEAGCPDRKTWEAMKPARK